MCKIIVLICAVSALSLNAEIVPLAVSGDGAANAGGAQYKSFNYVSAQTGAGGMGVLQVTLKGEGVTSSSDEALYIFGPDGLNKIAREGDTVREATNGAYVDLPGTVFRSFADFRVSANGDVVFTARLTTLQGFSDPTITNGYRDDGVWYYRHQNKQLVPISREGNPIGSLSGAKYWNDLVLKPQIGSGPNPNVVYSLTLTDPGLYVGGEEALVRWRYDGEKEPSETQDEPSMIWRKSIPAVTYSSVTDPVEKPFNAYLSRFFLSGDAGVVFQTASNSSPAGFYLHNDAGPWVAILQYGQNAPGVEDKKFTPAPTPEAKVAGLSFAARVGVTNGVGLFTGTLFGEGMKMLLMEDANAPGLGSATIDTIGRTQVNTLGQTLVWTKLFGAGIFPGINDEGLWLYDGQETTLLIQTGSVAKDSGMGSSYKAFGALFLNSSGDYVFQADLTGDAITVSNNEAIYCGRGKMMSKVVQKGDELLPEKKVTAIRLLGLDDQRNVFFHASWSGGEGLFYAPSVSIPQPDEGVGLAESWVTKEEWGAFVWSPWMDWVWVPGGGWIYTFRHGWLFMMDGYFFSLNRGTWLWTNSAYYPFWVEYQPDGTAVFIQNP